MTRQEQIVEDAEKFAGVNYDCESESDAFYHAVQKGAFVAGYEKGYKDAVDKACEWIEEHLLLDDHKWYVEGEKTLQEKMIDDLRKVMEEQQ